MSRGSELRHRHQLQFQLSNCSLIEELKQNIYDARIVTSHQIPGPNGAEAFFENMTDESRLAGMVGALPIAWESNLLPGFNLQYMNAYGSDAPAHAAASYDAAMILAQATIRAGSASGSDIKASIPDVGTDYAGISGNIISMTMATHLE